MAGPQAGFISLRDSIFGVGPTFQRITGMAQGDAIKIVQETPDVNMIEGSLGDATFVKTIVRVRRIELLLVPSSQDVTLLMMYRDLEAPFPWRFEFGLTVAQGFWMIDKDVDLVVSSSPSPTMVGGPAWVGSRKIGATGMVLQ